VRPINENVPVELNNYFRFEEMEDNETDLAGEPEEAEQAVVTSVSISVSAVQPPVIESGYQTPRQNRFLTINRRSYYQTRFGTVVPDPDFMALHAIASCGLNNPRSILSQMESDEETEDESVNLGS
jgi:hypothetical protein